MPKDYILCRSWCNCVLLLRLLWYANGCWTQLVRDLQSQIVSYTSWDSISTIFLVARGGELRTFCCGWFYSKNSSVPHFSTRLLSFLIIFFLTVSSRAHSFQVAFCEVATSERLLSFRVLIFFELFLILLSSSRLLSAWLLCFDVLSGWLEDGSKTISQSWVVLVLYFDRGCK